MFPFIQKKNIEKALNKAVPEECRHGKKLTVYHVRSALEQSFSSDNLYANRTQMPQVAQIMHAMSADVNPFVAISNTIAASRSGAARLAGHSIVLL